MKHVSDKEWADSWYERENQLISMAEARIRAAARRLPFSVCRFAGTEPGRRGKTFNWDADNNRPFFK